MLAEFRLFAVWCGCNRKVLKSFLVCIRFIVHAQIVFATTHAVLEHHLTMRVKWKGVSFPFLVNFIITLHLVFCRNLLTQFLFLHVVITIIVFDAKVALSTDSDRHLKIDLSLYYRWVRYRIFFFGA